MISGSKKNPPAGRGVAACVQGLVTSVTRERLAIAAGGSCGTNTPRKPLRHSLRSCHLPYSAGENKKLEVYYESR